MILLERLSSKLRQIDLYYEYDSFTILVSLQRYKSVSNYIQLGVNLNHFDKLGSTPLSTAIRNNDVIMVVMLVQSGADVNCPTRNGATPLEVAEHITDSMIRGRIIDALRGR